MHRPTEESLQHSCKTVNGHRYVGEQQEQGSSMKQRNQGDHVSLAPGVQTWGLSWFWGALTAPRTDEPGPGARQESCQQIKVMGSETGLLTRLQHCSEVPSFDKTGISCIAVWTHGSRPAKWDCCAMGQESRGGRQEHEGPWVFSGLKYLSTKETKPTFTPFTV